MTVVSPELLPHCTGSLWCLPEDTVTGPCACGEPQAMSHIVDSCPLIKLANGWSKLHSADDDDAVAWLTNSSGP